MKTWRIVAVLAVLLLLALLGASWLSAEAQRYGEVLVRSRGWELHASLPGAALALLIAALLLWLLWQAITSPLRAWRRKRRKQARGKLIEGLHALHFGQWQHAEKLLQQASGDDEVGSLALLHAARAANARGDDAATQAHLQSLESAHPQVHAIARAEIALAQQQPQAALDALQLTAGQPPLPRALVIQAQALAALHRAAEAQYLLPAVKEERALSKAEYDALEASLARQAALESPTPAAVVHDENGIPRLGN